MRTAVACAVAFVAALALVARSADQAAPPEKPAARPSASAPVSSVAPSVRAPSTAVEPAAAPTGRPVFSSPASPEIAVRAPSPANLASKLERELGLGVAQRARVEEIFRIRDAQVAAIQRRILQSGYFSARETDPQLVSLREESYVQVSMLLDREQNRRFAETLRTNSINDHVAIALPDSLVLLD